MSRRILVPTFVSFAQADSDVAEPFLDLLHWQLAPSSRWDVELWHFHLLVAGDTWDAVIQSKLTASELGIVLVSPAALASRYIAVSELPALLGKPIVPVLLRPVDFEHHDLRGLQHRQIFCYRARAFSELTTRHQREAFAAALYEQIELRLAPLPLVGATR